MDGLVFFHTNKGRLIVVPFMEVVNTWTPHRHPVLRVDRGSVRSFLLLALKHCLVLAPSTSPLAALSWMCPSDRLSRDLKHF